MDLTAATGARRRARLAAAPLSLLLGLIGAASAAEFAPGSTKHLGVASCASSVCHGKLTAQSGRDVGLNEYRIWSHDDYHSRAYRDLANAQSQAIAAKLGLASASTAKICLDCHADNVAQELRGPKFQLSDGVGCEACHGGAEKWIETHAQTSALHADNVARGMYPSEQPLRRAELCLSCHMGTRDKFATHMIMGAGHPRLRFELEVFTSNQPAHFTVDADYVQRKGRIEGMNLWVTGQIENARRYLELLQSPLLTPAGLVPELALYDCFSCHHPTDKQRWSRSRAGNGILPGTLRLQKYHLVMIQAISEVLAPDALPDLVSASDGLIRAGQTDVASLKAAAQKLHAWIDAHDDWARRQYTSAQVAQVRKTVIRYASEDKASDFGAAEQVVMGVESLSYTIGDHDKHKAAIDALYNAVKSSSGFDPTQFAGVARGVQSQF
jgi:hypothetical protein